MVRSFVNYSARHATPARPRKTLSKRPSTRHTNWLTVSIPRNIMMKTNKQNVLKRTNHFIKQLINRREKEGMKPNIERKIQRLRGLKNHAKHVPSALLSEMLRNIMLGNRKS